MDHVVRISGHYFQHCRNMDYSLVHYLQVRRVLLEWLPWILMMSRPGTSYICGEAIIASETSSRTKLDDYDSINMGVISSGSAYDAQLLLLQKMYNEIKEVIII